MPLKFPIRIRFFTHPLPGTRIVSLNSGARAHHSSSSVPFLFRVFSSRLNYFAFGSRINFSSRPSGDLPEFGQRSRGDGDIRASRSLIDDEEELSNWVSDLRPGSFRFHLTSEDDDSGPDAEDRSRGRNQDKGAKSGRERESDEFRGFNRRGTRNQVGSFRDKRYGDRDTGLSGQGSFRGRKERSLDSGIRRDRGRDREDYKGLRKREQLLEDESSDEDVKSLVMGGFGDLLSEDDEEEDQDCDFLRDKAASAFGFDKEKAIGADKARNADHVKTSDSYLTKTR
ncbi:unnamed protein product [Thlaspi arvense]|uniref:Uncharacterized protein n=1 Tax=Thlaspi arvense TaxID=13288 RepID=A0AAU9RJY2_THLAR|nr:unnamed protein product [Thlaspi arvense]